MSKASTLSRIAVGAAATAATAATSASGAVVVFDFPDVSYDNFVNMGAVSFGQINPGAGTFEFTPSNSAPGFSAGMDYNYGLVFDGFQVSAATSGGYLGVVAPGGTVSSSLAFASYDTNYGSSLPRSVFYLGLKLTQDGQDHYGWLELSATDAPPGGYTTVTFRRFAFEDVAGQSITTPVPEASTFGLVGGLFGLAAAVHLRRRQQKQAAASDKFLALAAGEKLN